LVLNFIWKKLYIIQKYIDYEKDMPSFNKVKTLTLIGNDEKIHDLKNVTL